MKKPRHIHTVKSPARDQALDIDPILRPLNPHTDNHYLVIQGDNWYIFPTTEIAFARGEELAREHIGAPVMVYRAINKLVAMTQVLVASGIQEE